MTSGFIISNAGLIVPVTVKKLMCLEYLYHELFIQTENSRSENKKILRALSFQDSLGKKKKKVQQKPPPGTSCHSLNLNKVKKNSF